MICKNFSQQSILPLWECCHKPDAKQSRLGASGKVQIILFHFIIAKPQASKACDVLNDLCDCLHNLLVAS